MLTQNGSVGSRNTSLIGSIGWASQVMIRSEKLKVAMKPMSSAISAHDDPLPQLAQVGEEGHAALLDVLRGRRRAAAAFRKNITRPGPAAPARAGSRRG